MNDLDRAWLAGLLEGEGSFDLHRDRYPRVRLGMTDRDVVERAARLMGSRVRASLRMNPYATSWHAEISGPRAAEIMREILPYMGARRSAKIGSILGEYAFQHTGASVLPGPRLKIEGPSVSNAA